jgi:hypothetical protein
MHVEAATHSAEHELSTTTVCFSEPHTIGTLFIIATHPEMDCFLRPTAKEASVAKLTASLFFLFPFDFIG